MKNFILILAIIFFLPAIICASPFLVCDPQSEVGHYVLTGPTWVPVNVTAEADGSIRMDVAGANVGINSITVRACKSDPLWGELCSEIVPFDFTRPAGAAPPSGIGLIR